MGHIWNHLELSSRQKKKQKKRTITKCCPTVCRSIEKRHGVWAGASVADVQWLYMQHASDILWFNNAVSVVAQTSYFVSASYFDKKTMKWSYVNGYARWLWKAQNYSICLVLMFPSITDCIMYPKNVCWWICNRLLKESFRVFPFCIRCKWDVTSWVEPNSSVLQ